MPSREVGSDLFSEMAIKEEELARFRNQVWLDAYHDVSRAKAGNRPFDEELRLLQEDSSIDGNYKVVLLCLLTMEERLSPPKKKNEKDDVTEQKESSDVLRKRKDKEDVREQDADCSTEEENDPDYELFLKHLKEDDKSYVLEYKTDNLAMVFKYEGETDSDDPEPEPRRKLNKAHDVVKEKIHGANGLKEQDQGPWTGSLEHRPSNQMHGEDNQHRDDPQLISVKKNNNICEVENVDGADPKYVFLHQNGELEGDSTVSLHKSHAVVNQKINDEKGADERKLPRAMKPKSGFPNQMPGVETKRLTRSKSRFETDKEENHLLQNDKLEDDPHVRMHEGATVMKMCGMNDEKKHRQRNLDRDMKKKVGHSNQMPCADNQRNHDAQPASARKNLTVRKSRTEAHNVWVEKCSASEFRKVKAAKCFMAHKSTDERNMDKDTNKKLGHSNQMRPQCEKIMDKDMKQKGILSPGIKKIMSGLNDQKKECERNMDKNMKQKVGHSNQKPRVKNECKHDRQPATAKSPTLRKSNDGVQNVKIEKCSVSEFRKAKAGKCVMAYKNIDKSNVDKEGKCGSDSDVEILDEAAYLIEGVLSPFVSSKKFARSMLDGTQHIGRSSARDEFRKGVLGVLQQPYDKDEYTRHQEALRAGGYLDHYTDLGGKLRKYRYNRRKRLAILRGFFYWLQNLTQEGSFKPWKDRACLAVEPPSQDLPDQDDG